ncbi:MAG TPA: hypothetical protein VMY37_01850 [Thermoguttaceae bacterium]|nr:hypothetical protein [Thermoguttaceae bacterium]
MCLRFLGLSVLAVLLLSSAASGATYYLAPDGSDDAPGTRGRPWQTLAKANAALAPGDTAVLANGEYEGVVEPARSGREDAPITYRGESSRAAVIKGGPSSDGARTCVRLRDRQYVVIDGLRLVPHRGGWMKLDSAGHCLIRRCHMENATGVYSPIECRDCHYNRYEDLRCWRSLNVGEYGHVSGDMWNNFGSGHNVFERIHISRAGHRPFGLWHDSPHNVVRSCIFDCRWGRNFECFSTPRLLMERCVITNGFEGSGSADGRAKLFVIDSIFRHNVIYRNYYGPLVINSYKYGADEPWKMTGSRLYHNTWYRNHEYGFEMVDFGANPQPHMVTGNLFQNNVFSGNDPGGDGLALLLYANIAEDNLFKHNLLFGAKPGDKTVRYDSASPGASQWPGLTMTADEANRKKPDQFAGNLDADPLFVEPPSDDYRLRAESPGIDAAGPLAVARQSGSGREIAVDDARPFYDGFGIPGEQGDLVFIGPKKQQAIVTRADLDAGVLALDRDLAWEAGDGVSLPYAGDAPDLGAFEHGAEGEPWYAGPSIPAGLRVETMETATEPVVAIDFEPENREQWFYYFSFSRQRNTTARLDDSTAASGKHSMRVFAEKDGATMSCHLRPRWWDVDRFPIVRFAYRIPQGVPVGVWVHAFRSTRDGRGEVCVGGSPARERGRERDLACLELVDDDQWHEAEFDARHIRDVFPDVKLVQTFRFYTSEKGKRGQQFWFDDFRILPKGHEE